MNKVGSVDKTVIAKPRVRLKEEVAKYLASIGARGGKKSRRKLSKKEARRIANVRWKKATNLAQLRQAKPCEPYDHDALTEFNLKRYKRLTKSDSAHTSNP